MGVIWPLVRALGDGMLAPFLWMPPVPALVSLSGVTGLVLLAAFRWLTPQRALRRTKDGMSAALYEMRVFSAAPGQVLLAQGRAIWLTLRYLALATPSLLVLGPLLALLVARASLPFEHRPVAPGERVLLCVELDRAVDRSRLAMESELDLLPPRLHLSGGRRVCARLRARRPGVFHVAIRVDGREAARKRVVVDHRYRADLSPTAARADDVHLLLGREPSLDAGPVRRVELDYPRQTLSWLGMPWWLDLLLLSLVVALLLRRRLGVVF
jgi:hypothetical protein